MINPLSYILSQGSKVPWLISNGRVYPGAVGFDSKKPFEEPCNCRLRAKGLIIHDKEGLAVFIPHLLSSIFKQFN